MRFLSLTKTFILMKYKVILEYKAAFWVASFAQILNYSVDLLLLWLLVLRFRNLGGWMADEIVFLYSLQLLSYAIAGTFFFGCCTYLNDRIQSGQFDEALTLPMHPLVYEVFSHFTTDYIRHFVLALAFFIFSALRLQIELSFVKILMLVLNLLGGALINSAALLIFSMPNFWMVKGNSVLDLFYYDVLPFINYPITIFPTFLHVILTFFLPYAFVNFYPAQYFLGKSDFFHF